MEIKIDPSELKPIIEQVVSEVIIRFKKDEDRIAFTEEEAARMLGVPATSLRDERLRNRIEACLVGRRIRYTKSQLLTYLSNRKWESKH